MKASAWGDPGSGRNPGPEQRHGISHLLLDIEGTTCPVSFVVDTLFPYARTSVGRYLRLHGGEPAVAELIAELDRSQAEEAPQAPALAPMKTEAYARWLMESDRKLPALKELQGLIWEEGYRRGDLQAPLFDEVPAVLQRWQRQGRVLAVYSSGSVKAQKLLYRHSTAGDLTPLFSHWFDTRTGNKKQSRSYTEIAAVMRIQPAAVLFISDARQELEAAAAAGMHTLFSLRQGNPERSPGPFPWISTLEAVAV